MDPVAPGEVTRYPAMAVGTACGANPVPLVVPCHRVVTSNGKLGGYGGGLPLKKMLLKAEGIDPDLLAA